MADILVAIGTNHSHRITDLTETIQSALGMLDDQHPVTICDVSRLFVTKAVPAGSGPDFVNAVFSLTADLPSKEILQILHRVEQEFGRDRSVRWGQRSLDLDLLGRKNEILPNRATVETWMKATPVDGVIAAPDQLILPHPRLHERAFVLVPAQDVAPEWTHPILRESVSEMLANLPEGDRESVRTLV